MRFSIAQRGVGLPDYNTRLERSVSPSISPILRQRAGVATFEGLLPTQPWPDMYRALLELPQENGGWAFTASTITLHWVDIGVFLTSNHLAQIEFVRYASLDDFFADIPAEVSPGVFGYGEARIVFSKGIYSQPGSCYGERFGFWSNRPDEYVTLNTLGLVTDLTPPYMRWGAM